MFSCMWALTNKSKISKLQYIGSQRLSIRYGTMGEGWISLEKQIEMMNGWKRGGAVIGELIEEGWKRNKG